MANDSVARSIALSALEKAGQGGGEPNEYLKSASVSDNTLTLTNKDGTTVNFTPESSEPDEYIKTVYTQDNGEIDFIHKDDAWQRYNPSDYINGSDDITKRDGQYGYTLSTIYGGREYTVAGYDIYAGSGYFTYTGVNSTENITYDPDDYEPAASIPGSMEVYHLFNGKFVLPEFASTATNYTVWLRLYNPYSTSTYSGLTGTDLSFTRSAANFDKFDIHFDTKFTVDNCSNFTNGKVDAVTIFTSDDGRFSLFYMKTNFARINILPDDTVVPYTAINFNSGFNIHAGDYPEPGVYTSTDPIRAKFMPIDHETITISNGVLRSNGSGPSTYIKNVYTTDNDQVYFVNQDDNTINYKPLNYLYNGEDTEVYNNQYGTNVSTIYGGRRTPEYGYNLRSNSYFDWAGIVDSNGNKLPYELSSRCDAEYQQGATLPGMMELAYPFSGKFALPNDATTATGYTSWMRLYNQWGSAYSGLTNTQLTLTKSAADYDLQDIHYDIKYEATFDTILSNNLDELIIYVSTENNSTLVYLKTNYYKATGEDSRWLYDRIELWAFTAKYDDFSGIMYSYIPIETPFIPIDYNTLNTDLYGRIKVANPGNSVSVSATGTATDEVGYITIDGVEKKLAGGGGASVPSALHANTADNGVIISTTPTKLHAGKGGLSFGHVDDKCVLGNDSGLAALSFGYVEGNNSTHCIQAKSSGAVAFGRASYTNIAATNSAAVAGGYADRCKISSSGTGSIAFGYSYGSSSGGSTSGIHADGSGSVAIGYVSSSSADAAHRASGAGSVALGHSTQAASAYQTAIGKLNINDSNNTYGFIVGNGAESTQEVNRSNAFTLDWQGNGVFAGTVSSSGSDYAEFFEWKDGNPDKEDRIAYIVTLDNGKIKLANENDDILGIISGTTSMTGDDAEWTWHGKFLQDKYGRFIYEDYDVTHEEGTEHEWVEHVHTRKINPDYDPERPYIPRSERPEWSEVGLLGKLFVRDDGTAEVNGYVKASNGIATNSTEKTNMRVLERIDANTIRVLLK